MYKIKAERADFVFPVYFKAFCKWRDSLSNEQLICLIDYNEHKAKKYRTKKEAMKDLTVVSSFGYDCELVG